MRGEKKRAETTWRSFLDNLRQRSPGTDSRAGLRDGPDLREGAHKSDVPPTTPP